MEAALLDRIKELTEAQREQLLSRLNIKQLTFVKSLASHGNKARAAREAGYGAPNAKGSQLSQSPKIQAALQAELDRHSERCDLDAEYVRKYLLDILELCPTDYFVLGPKGEWMIDPAAWENVPKEVRRLVDNVETRNVGGQMIWKVNFVSKAAALAIAARFTLVQKVEVTEGRVPWDKLYLSAQLETRDPIAERLKEHAELIASGQLGTGNRVCPADGEPGSGASSTEPVCSPGSAGIEESPVA